MLKTCTLIGFTYIKYILITGNLSDSFHFTVCLHERLSIHGHLRNAPSFSQFYLLPHIFMQFYAPTVSFPLNTLTTDMSAANGLWVKRQNKEKNLNAYRSLHFEGNGCENTMISAIAERPKEPPNSPIKNGSYC